MLVQARALEAAPHLFHAVALDDVADAHVLVALEGHAALLAGRHFARVVLEALELAEPAFVNHDVVADEPDMGAALDHAVEDAAARDLADLRDVEDLEDLRLAEPLLAQRRGEKARHRRLHVVHEVVDDVVVADLDAGPLGGLAGLLVGADVEAEHDRAGGLRQRDVGFRDGADAGLDHAGRDLFVAGLLERADDRLGGALDVGPDDERKLLAAGALLQVAHHLGERAPGGAGAGGLALALLAGAILRDLAGARLR